MPVKLRVLGVPFGGHLAGKDSDGEFFSPRTDVGLEDAGRMPLFWHHAMDTIKKRIGYAENWRKGKDGWWCDVTVTDDTLAVPIRRMAEAGALFASSGALAHLVTRANDGHVDRWLVGELSLTGNPTNRLARAELAPAADAPADVVAVADRMLERTFDMQRLSRGDRSVDRLQDAVANLRETLAA